MGATTIYMEPVTSAPWTVGEGTPAGVIRWEGQKCYKTVILAATQTADIDFDDAGDAVGYSDYSAHTVVADATDAAEGAAGVTVYDGAIDMTAEAGKVMWIQIKGPATVDSSVGGSVGAQDRIELNTSSTDTVFDKCTTLKASCGHMINTTTEVYLDCPY